LTKWCIGEMTISKNSKFTYAQNCEIAISQNSTKFDSKETLNDKLSKWQNNEMTSCQNGKFT
jgi:hypothetical protein